MTPLVAAGMFGLGGMELVILIVLALLLFGKRLPEVGRSLGKGIIEFKKGLKGLEDEVEGSTQVRSELPAESARPPQKIGLPASPKFDQGSAGTSGQSH